MSKNFDHHINGFLRGLFPSVEALAKERDELLAVVSESWIRHRPIAHTTGRVAVSPPPPSTQDLELERDASRLSRLGIPKSDRF